MYRIRTKVYSKRDPVKRWALPDRVFFACGACHILAHAFLHRYGSADQRVLWIKPDAGWTGQHIVIAAQDWVFDYHGYSDRRVYLSHTWKKARRWWPGWDAQLLELPRDVLISASKSREYEGLRLREPGEFLHDPRPRANHYLQRFPAPPER